MMFASGQLEQRESQSIALDDQGVSESYFPLWGISNVDEYLQSSNDLRAVAEAAKDLAKEPAEAQGEMPAEAQGEAQGEADQGESTGQGSSFAEHARDAASYGEDRTDARFSAGMRVAWGVWFWVKRVALFLLVFAVGSLLVTMALNPSMTFVEAANALFEGVIDFLRGILI